MVTDLTNTTWYFKSEIDVESDALTFDLAFSSNGVLYIGAKNATGPDTPDFVYVKMGSRPSQGTEDIVVYRNNSWVEENYRLITITGGPDVTNTNFITWLDANATQLTVTDLTNTMWVFNGTISDFDGLTPKQFNINFTSNNQTFSAITDGAQSLEDWALAYSNVTVYDSGRWVSGNYHTIEIIGGTSVTNTELIVWLNANATQIIDTKKYISAISQNNQKYLVKDTEVRTSINNIIDTSGHIDVEEETMIWVVGKPAITSTFTINYYGTVYTYTFSPTETPTWNDFISSKYNDGSFRLYGESEVAFGGVGDAVYSDNGNNPVHSNDNIISEHLYYAIHGGN